jgi:hypothetical protein
MSNDKKPPFDGKNHSHPLKKGHRPPRLSKEKLMEALAAFSHIYAAERVENELMDSTLSETQSSKLQESVIMSLETTLYILDKLVREDLSFDMPLVQSCVNHLNKGEMDELDTLLFGDDFDDFDLDDEENAQDMELGQGQAQGQGGHQKSQTPNNILTLKTSLEFQKES